MVECRFEIGQYEFDLLPFCLTGCFSLAITTVSDRGTEEVDDFGSVHSFWVLLWKEFKQLKVSATITALILNIFITPKRNAIPL